MGNPVLTIVSPFFNEEEGLRHFAARLKRVCDSMQISYEVILVDDGSTDASVTSLSEIEWAECSLLRLVANVGHQNALDAGLQAASGDWVVTMDADGQHPPELIPDLLRAIQSNSLDVVYGVPRNRAKDSWFKRTTARTYYKFMRVGSGVELRENAADFRIMSKDLVETINRIPEEKVFRLLIPSLGYRSSEVLYDAEEREFGRSKYTLRKMTSLAIVSVVAFSPLPLRWVSIMGLITAAVAFILVFFVIASYLLGDVVPGWASVMVVVLFVGGIQLMAIGVMGEYMIRLQKAVSNRPNFIVRDRRSLVRTDPVEVDEVASES